MPRVSRASGGLRPVSPGGPIEAPLAEHELTSLWLTGRVPASVLPWPLLRAGRPGRGAGPDVREATFARSGVPVTGDVEVHLRATDFARHGHESDPAYGGVLLHLVWDDDRPAPERGTATPLPGGGSAATVAVGPLLGGQPRRLRALLARGPLGTPPCAACASADLEGLVRAVRREGQRRLAERTRRAGTLAVEHGWAGAWARLLDHALARSAGRHAESPAARAALAEAITAALSEGGSTLERALVARASSRDRLVAVLRAGDRLGSGRASELAWNAALPLLIALATAYDDVALARQTAELARAWPAPRPYGRTHALAEALLGRHVAPSTGPARHGAAPHGGGALWAQGLLHLQDLWCSRGGCGACPLSAPSMGDTLAAAHVAPAGSERPAQP